MDKSSALDYINQMFPTEASLSGVEPLMQKIHSEIRRVDAGILTAVRQQLHSLSFFVVDDMDRMKVNGQLQAVDSIIDLLPMPTGTIEEKPQNN